MAWNRRSSERSFSMYLRYSAGVVAPMQRISPRESAGFRMLAASSDPSADPAPTSVCSSSMNTMMFGFSVSSFMIAFRRSSNWPRYFVPATISEMSSARMRLSARKCGTSPQTIFCARPSTMAVLPTPGSPMSTALFLVRRQSTCWTRSSSTCAADERIELVLHRGLGQVAAELGEQRRLLRPRRRRLLVQELDDVLADAREPHPLLVQDGRRDRPLLAQDAEQQVLGADVGVQQPVGFFGGELQHALGLGAEGNLDRGRDLLAEDRAAFDFLADALEREVRPREDPARQALAFANQSEQQMLGLDRRAAELGRFIAREEQDAPRAFRIAFKHPNVRREQARHGVP